MSLRYFLKMPYMEKTSRRTDKAPTISKGNDKELHALRRLLSLLNTPICKTQNHSKGGKTESHLHHRPTGDRSGIKCARTEDTELESFSLTYRDQRHFSSHPHDKIFQCILTALIRNRLNCREWLDHTHPDNILRVLICLRLLIREPHYQRVFHELQGSWHLSRYMDSVSDCYLDAGEQTLGVEHLVTMTYVFQKIAAKEDQRKWVIECGAHKILVKLLTTKDSSVLLGALLALTSLAESVECKEKIGELCIVENLLVILQEYDLLSKRTCAELLRLLCPVRRVREQLKACEGVPVLLSLLHADHLKLLWSVAWVLVQLCQDPDANAEIRAWGGVQQLLRILHVERAYVSDRASIETLSSANAARRIQRQHLSEELSPQETAENIMALQAACCAAVTELVLDDATAHHIVQENGIYIIAKLILPQAGPKGPSLQCYAFRTLRFLFSIERNRHLFKKLFPSDLFEMFIDVGHYVRDIAAYEPLQEKVSFFSSEELNELKESIEIVNQNRPPLKVINGYAILDHLGSGAFGSVFKVRKQNGQNLLALKEVNLHNPAFGKDKKARDSSVEKIVSELTIIKEQMNHPNIVKYIKTFLEGDRMYIVMELIEGLPLSDHFTSLKEKQQQFTEDRVWNVFIQLCLALRYLHKEKRIVHRDLSPNNIMLGEKDKVTITDFGLAKQKQENSKLMSVVGTILYSCPEIVKSEPYGEKADVWAVGCILYHMVTLQPPFYSTNMLSLATKIVEAVYEPIEEGVFSERVKDLIKWCLTPDPDSRPDIVEVSARISDVLMKFMDNLCASHQALERRSERDRKRAQKYFLESNQARLGHWMAPISQGKIIKENEEACSEAGSVSIQHSSQCSSQAEGDSQPSSEYSSQAEVKQEHQANSFEKHSRTASSSATELRKKSFRPTECSVSLSLSERTPAWDFLPQPKSRPATAGIFVSQRKLRQIEDPVQRLVGLLHKIIYICQLPPAQHYNHRRRTIERFKKSLFHQGSNPYSLKVELNKVLQGSSDLVESVSSCRDWWSQVQSFGGEPFSTEPRGESGYAGLQDGITYEQLQTLIEDELEENGYHSRTASRSDQEAMRGNQRPYSPSTLVSSEACDNEAT
ncbi:serine/threonine-protein kinase Nek10 isoform X2 [Alosa sapidissima]|uniref:serine/threonine-protein kinase Nek10 isoform X2 n=1 Tax=Alosa sapidissima TaxID=34773 RepID=UPI001C08945D|nr:serine/threonine-protein kinase Nek10 isoform X2 [Alosa sapidissima]